MRRIHAAGVFAALFLFTLAAIPVALAGGTPEDSGQGVHVNDEGIAAQGADVVAYFSLPAGGAHVAGDPRYSYQYAGATWFFANAANRDRFAEDPDAYMPAFGGYCSWAMARDSLATIDPDRWAIVEGTLYLNFNRRTHSDWLEHRDQQIESAAEHWPRRREQLLSGG